IPAGAAVTSVKTAGTAASVLSKMARVVDLIDPGAWAVNGSLRLASTGLGSLDNLISGLNTAGKLDVPHLEVHAATDTTHAMNLLDDFGTDLNTVTVHVDAAGNNVFDFPGGRIETPAASFDAALRNAGGGTDAATHAPVREPELVTAGGGRGQTGHGAVNTIVHDGPVRTDTGGSGDTTAVHDPDTTTGGGGGGDHGEGASRSAAATGGSESAGGNDWQSGTGADTHDGLAVDAPSRLGDSASPEGWRPLSQADLDGLPVVRDGSHINPDGTLQSNTWYQTGEHEYLYHTDENGHIDRFYAEELQLKEHEGRLRHDPNTPGKLPGDHAGHLAADRFGGSPLLDNLVSQFSDVNLRHYKGLENVWAEALGRTPPGEVSVDVRITTDASGRPTRFDVQSVVNGKPIDRFFTQ
ncbi:DNA/RNA non-specific endonuclease, partial [Microbacterium sp. BWT-B31]|uniref:DNA/RNA non-specific endonuclease n=1 Tax=Microbacterium sp. BWT-B31 TaxID=3232072 RepID=UPI0035293CFA